MKKIEALEEKRQTIQSELDRSKSQEERNSMGQFSTPISLATDILGYAKGMMPGQGKIRFLDPAIGTGAFFSALNTVFPLRRIEAATGFEIDQHYGKPATKLWSDTLLDFHLSDFTKAIAPENEADKFNLIICNPPYVRHHHINGHKERLQTLASNSANMHLSGLAGLYCYFIALSHGWLQRGGIAGWLIPSEFMDVNYGTSVKEYLLREVTLLQIHRFEPNDVQFDDALVSSAIVWFKYKKPSLSHKVRFTYGGDLQNPYHEKEVGIKILTAEKKWTRFPLSDERPNIELIKLDDFFTIKRGIATGDNKYFVMPLDQIKKLDLPIEQFRPILPSPRYLQETTINADPNGNPVIKKQLFVLDCNMPVEEIKRTYPNLYEYLQNGVDSGVPEGYLCKNRKVWYKQENRSVSNFYCTYIGRSNKEGKSPFRFILNHSQAIVANSYLILYPKPDLQNHIDRIPNLTKMLAEALNRISGKAMIEEGRVYGGGLHKMEPRELANVSALEISKLLKSLNNTPVYQTTN